MKTEAQKIEGDMRLPILAARLHPRYSPGLSNVLVGRKEIKGVLQEPGLHGHLQASTSGEVPPDPSGLLGMEPMNCLVRPLSFGYDFIIIDPPPVKGEKYYGRYGRSHEPQRAGAEKSGG